MSTERRTITDPVFALLDQVDTALCEIEHEACEYTHDVGAGEARTVLQAAIELLRKRGLRP